MVELKLQPVFGPGGHAYAEHMEIRGGEVGDLGAVADLLGEAFCTDPVMREYVLPAASPADTSRLRRLLTQYFLSELESEYFPHGRVDIAEEDGQLLGAALWLPPDSQIGFPTRLKQLVTLTRLLGPGIFRALRMLRYWSRHTPKFPHWYLYTLAADPSARGRGIGTALLTQGLDRVGNDPVYLEATSTGAASLYARYGFVTLGEMHAHGRAKEIAMWRPGTAGAS